MQRVAAILAELREDVEKHQLSQESMFITNHGLVLPTRLIQVVERESLLEELKIYGRDVNNSDPIYTKDVSIE